MKGRRRNEPFRESMLEAFIQISNLGVARFTRTNFEFGGGWVWQNSVGVGLEMIIGWNLRN